MGELMSKLTSTSKLVSCRSETQVTPYRSARYVAVCSSPVFCLGSLSVDSSPNEQSVMHCLNSKRRNIRSTDILRVTISSSGTFDIARRVPNADPDLQSIGTIGKEINPCPPVDVGFNTLTHTRTTLPSFLDTTITHTSRKTST